MTQLDLPPVSFARYLDLLKRRKWQVIPVSVLGLIIGAVMALLVPRYFVASAEVGFRGKLLGAEGGDDPMAPFVEGAKHTIRGTVEKVLDELGWPEARAESRTARRAFVDKVRNNIDVEDLGPHTRQRTMANVRITYRDTDRDRAKSFLDALVVTWIAERHKDLEDDADTQLHELNDLISRETRIKGSLEQELQTYEAEHKINPQDFAGRADGGVSDLTRRLNDAKQSVARLEGRVEGLQSQIAELEEDRLETPPKLPRRIDAQPVSQALQAQIEAVSVALLRAQAGLRNTRPGHPDNEKYKRDVQQYTARLAQLRGLTGAGKIVEEDNESYKRIVEALDAARAELASVRAELATYRRTVAEREARLDKLPKINAAYRLKLERIAKVNDRLDKLEEERQGIERHKRELSFVRPYTAKTGAYVPPQATDPNVYLVALAGSAIGLAIAIGLILLLDVLQSTFKTVDDVERGLAIPMLGAMAHLTTVEDRRRSTARRTRVALVAATFLLLTLTLVTIYYVSPARLPAGVRDVLQIILGDVQSTGR